MDAAEVRAGGGERCGMRILPSHDIRAELHGGVGRFGLMWLKEKSGRAPLRLECVDMLRFDQNPWNFCILLNRLPDSPLGIDLQNGNSHFSATQVAANSPVTKLMVRQGLWHEHFLMGKKGNISQRKTIRIRMVKGNLEMAIYGLQITLALTCRAIVYHNTCENYTQRIDRYQRNSGCESTGKGHFQNPSNLITVF